VFYRNLIGLKPCASNLVYFVTDPTRPFSLHFGCTFNMIPCFFCCRCVLKKDYWSRRIDIYLAVWVGNGWDWLLNHHIVYFISIRYWCVMFYRNLMGSKSCASHFCMSWVQLDTFKKSASSVRINYILHSCFLLHIWFTLCFFWCRCILKEDDEV
jgi:hypothetical protein